MKSFSNEDNHMAHIWWKKKNSSISSRSSDSQFVLVRAGLAQAVGWKIMVIWWSVRDSGSLTSSSMCAKWISSLENHFMLNIWSHLKKKIWHLMYKYKYKQDTLTRKLKKLHWNAQNKCNACLLIINFSKHHHSCNHSSEIRGLCLTKSSSKTLQYFPYFWNAKTHVVFFVFHFVLLYFSPNKCPGLCRDRPGHSLGKK